MKLAKEVTDGSVWKTQKSKGENVLNDLKKGGC